ncbi:flagellin [Microvirga pakistanensis]|uniref:flagellin N-terminal helical domain-containing protein n=1 Tax=Microvirga pakistanensis TaxID=1682650 RepID=UPI00106C6B68|nr:flagellin [Microvirga pakistanensis]
MSSINTNLSAMTALQALKSTQSAMNKTQNQISTGLRVGSAADNASYFSIATQMRSDNGALGAVKDSIKQSKSMIDTFTTALSKISSYLDKAKQNLVNATQPGAQQEEINTELKKLVEGIKNTAASANFNGENWLQTDDTTAKELVVSYDSNGAASSKVGTVSVTITDTQMFDAAQTGGHLGALMTALDTGYDNSVAATSSQALLDDVEDAIDLVKTAAAQLGATKALLETQEEFIGVLSDSLTAGVSAFVDADMNEASTRFQALQTQQQLGVQSLSMANQNSQMILKLFQ